MNIKRALLGFVAFGALGAAPAFADNGDLIERQRSASKSLKHYNFDLQETGVKRTKYGRSDTGFVSRGTSQTEMVQKLQNAYRMRTNLPNGYRVSGWAEQATGSYTFTLRHTDGSTVVAEVFPHSEGSEVLFWGKTRDHKGKRSSRLNFYGM